MWDTSKQMLAILEDMPPWPRFPNEMRDWSRDQVETRFPIWDLWSDSLKKQIPVTHQNVWAVYGRGVMAVHVPEWPQPVGHRAPGSSSDKRHVVERILSNPAQTLPPAGLLDELLRTWRGTLLVREDVQPEVVVRNEWAERIATIKPAMQRITALMPQATREVRRSGGIDMWLNNLLHDQFLHDEVVDQAIAQLRKTVAQEVLRGAAKNPTASVEPIVAEIEAQQQPATRQVHAVTQSQLPPANLFAKHAHRFEQFAAEFDKCRAILLDNPSNHHPIAEIRTIMAGAGMLLVELVRQGAIPPPSPASAPWLAWLAPAPHLRFDMLVYTGISYGLNGLTFEEVLHRMASMWFSSHHGYGSPSVATTQSFHFRHVFLEAAIGWLASRCSPTFGMRMTTGFVAQRGADAGDVPYQEHKTEFVTDWSQGVADPVPLFLDIGRACAAVCQHLVEQLRHHQRPTSVEATGLQPTALPQQPPPPAASETVPNNLRISTREAIKGKPELSLPPTPRTTLDRWCRNPKSAADLGVNPKGKVSAQRPLVEGLLRMQAQMKTKRRPPQLGSG